MPGPRFGFTGKNVQAQHAAKTGSQLVTDISKQTRASLQRVIEKSIRDGVPPYDAARLIRDMVGLSDRQMDAVENYREELIDNGLNISRVDELVERYSDEKLQERAEMIARTEIMDALNEGQQESWAEAQDEGYLGPDATQEWITTPDDKLCDECNDLDGQAVGLDESFESDEYGEIDAPPLHPNCRCAIVAVP